MKVLSQAESFRRERLVKRGDMHRKSFNIKPKKVQMKKALPSEGQGWIINEWTPENLTREGKRKPLDDSSSGNWKIERIQDYEQLTNIVPPTYYRVGKACKVETIRRSEDCVKHSALSARESDISSPKLIRVDGEELLESESASGCAKRSVSFPWKQLPESNSGPAEFHHLSGKSYLLILRYPSRLHFRGVLSVTPIVGTTSFLGYEFTPGMKSHLIFSPKGTSPVYLRAVGNMNNGEVEILPKIPSVGISILNRIGSRDSAIILEPAHGEQWENLFGSFATAFHFNPLIPTIKEKKYAHAELNVELNLRVEFVQPGDSVASNRFHDESSEWDHLSEAVLNVNMEKGPFRLMVFGGKGVGKSTFMRFMVNQWLSKCRKRKKSGDLSCIERSALYIDFDPGQSEFMPPGCIAATIVSEPLLGPNYTHLKNPERMICIGELNVERCPDWYLMCADKLLKFCSSNPALCQIPWFINTMGFCRGIGGDLAVKLIQLCHPTHVIQLKSRFSRRNFDPIDLLSSQSVNSWRGMDWNPSTSNQKGTQVPDYFYYQLCSLAERSVVEDDNSNGIQGATENGTKTAPHQESEEMEDIDSEWGLPAWQSRNLCILAYFGQMVSGPKYSLLKPMPHMIKLSELILSLPSPLLKPQMITSAFNARLVVLCNFEMNQKSGNMPEGHTPKADACDIQFESATLGKKLPWEKVLKPDNSQYPRVLFHVPLAPCLGFGIIRAIDDNNHSLFLTTPVQSDVLASVNCLVTSPSIGSLPKELYFESLKLDTRRKKPIPYTVMLDKKSVLSRTIPRVFNFPSKALSTNRA